MSLNKFTDVQTGIDLDFKIGCTEFAGAAVSGGTSASGDLVLDSTTDATKGTIDMKSKVDMNNNDLIFKTDDANHSVRAAGNGMGANPAQFAATDFDGLTIHGAANSCLGTKVGATENITVTWNSNNVILNDGVKFRVDAKSNPDSIAGSVTLVAGTATIATTSITPNAKVFLSYQNAPTNPGFLHVDAVIDGVSFDITSSSGTDVSTVSWFIVGANA